MNVQHTEVLIIGAGPTGLFVAGELARHGVKPRIIDTLQTPHIQTRATEIQPAVLEVLHRSGLAGQFMNLSLPMKGLRVLDSKMEEAYVSIIPEANSLYPNTRSIPQWQSEKILTEWLTSMEVFIERGVTAEKITISENGARVECSDQEGNHSIIEADYLVGAGGAHSPLRGAFNEKLHGVTYPRHYLVADVETKDLHEDRHLISVAIAKSGMVMIIELPHGRSLVLTDIQEGRIPTEPLDIEDVRTAIGLHLEKPFEVCNLQWASTYRMHRRMSPIFTKERCFLAGDAAHISSPWGGEGLNAGILDGASLAWMLAAVLRRGGKQALLDAYEPERQDIARQVLSSSDAMHKYYDKLISMAQSGIRLSEPSADPTRKVKSNSMTDLSLSESPIIGFYGASIGVKTLNPGSFFPHRSLLQGCLHHLLFYPHRSTLSESFIRRWSEVLEVIDAHTICPPDQAGISSKGVVLVRPDGHIGFKANQWNKEAEAALNTLLSICFSPKII